MARDDGQPTGVDFAVEGLLDEELRDGEIVAGHVNGESILVIRRGADVFAIGATCTHYGGPLAEGIFDGEGIRCPWHHACFNVRTGAAARPPALKAVDTYDIIARDGRLYVGSKVNGEDDPPVPANPPQSVVIVGAGAAGTMAAGTLRDEGYAGGITLLAVDQEAPYDRPNLSKDYLAGSASEDWLPLRSPDFYAKQQVAFLPGRRVTGLDVQRREVVLDDGDRLGAGAILLATGADPVHLDIPGVDLPHVHYLRSLRDSRAIIQGAATATRAVVVGASFIGLEVAAALRTRGLEVHVVAPEAVPMERVLGVELGLFIKRLHEEHGVRFHLKQSVARIGERTVTLKDRSVLESDLVVIGVGVRPSVQLAQDAGLAIDQGVVVNEYLRTSAAGVWAAGDIARWPDPYSGANIRVEHWVVAERQGQTAARNILGRQERFDAVPFFWSQHYDVPINYVGHAEEWDGVDIAGSIESRDCLVAFRKDGKTLAVASIYRDLESLRAELAMERRNESALRELIAGS